MKNSIYYANIVKYGDLELEEEGYYLPFIESYYCIVILEENKAIDIFTHDIYDITPMIDEMIDEEFMYSYDKNKYYVYDYKRLDFSKVEKEAQKYFIAAYETKKWYSDIFVDNDPKIISLEKVKSIQNKRK